METIHADDSPLAAYLEGRRRQVAGIFMKSCTHYFRPGKGTFESDIEDDVDAGDAARFPRTPEPAERAGAFEQSFAPPARISAPRVRIPKLQPAPPGREPPKSAITRAHHACSSAVNSRLGASDNQKFLEHFRYTIVASQLLNEYLDHGSLNPIFTPPTSLGLDGVTDDVDKVKDAANLIGAVSVAAVAFALVYLIDWLRYRQLNKSRAALGLLLLAFAAFVGYGYLRRQWLQNLRKQAVDTATGLTTNWQAFELSSSSALSFIQEVELVSKGYRLSTPLPPASRIEETGCARRCAKLRRALHKAYASAVPACGEACASLRALIDEDDMERYYEVYDIDVQDAKEAAGPEALAVLEDDPESLKSLRVLSYRAGVIRRVTLCCLMALEADGGKADFARWRLSTDVMAKLNKTIAVGTERVRQVLSEMESDSLPSPAFKTTTNTPVRERMRGQVRKISALGTGIRGLQAKMQILREETNNAIEQTEDLTDLSPTLMAQYEAIGADLRELMQAWEAGKQSLQSNIIRHERRISMASSGLRSPVSSLGGLTAVDELVTDSCPPDGIRSKRSSMNTTSSDEEMVFEAIAMPRQRAVSTMTREERIAKMHEERVKQADLRARRDANTSMLRELESVINLRPKKTANGDGTNASPRVTSL